MVTALYAIAFVMVLGGVGVLVRGAPFIGVDWGNTLILSGTITACSGALLAGLAVALARLRGIERELAETREQAASNAASPAMFSEAAGLRPTQLSAEPAHPDLDSGPPPATEVQEFSPIRVAATASAPMPPDVGLGEAASASQFPHAAPFRPPPPEPEPEGPARAIPGFSTRPRAPPAVHDAYRGPERPDAAQTILEGTSGFEADAASGRPPGMPAVEPVGGPVRAIDDEWPEALPPHAGRSVDEERGGPAVGHSPAPPPAAPVESVSAADSAVPADEPAEPEEPPPQEIGRYSSGGNSYVMFADGSIEAETPNGRFRFGSLDELKQFIASGGERSASATG